jgi:exosortase/archaeosortase family protein
MANIAVAVKRNLNVVLVLLPILSFVAPVLILYSLYAWTFEQTYHGRTFLLFFLWLLVLEVILGWEKLQRSKLNKLLSIRTILFVATLLLPTIYVILANYYGLNTMISDLTTGYISPLKLDSTQTIIIAGQMSISIEYMVFAVLLCLMALVMYGINTLPEFSISTLFLGAIGSLFMIDELYPGGKATPLQALVPTTATLAEKVISFMGYHTSMSFAVDPNYGYMPYLFAQDPKNPLKFAYFGIAWPCAGIESLLLYTLTILLFLKKTGIPWQHRIVYFSVGAVVTYFINVFRVVTLFVIGIENGALSSEFQTFHNYYGMLYSITWIICYPLMIIGGQTLWGKIRSWKTEKKKTMDFSTQTSLTR